MAIPAPVEYYRDIYGCTASIRHGANGLWYLNVADAHGNRIRSRDAFVSHKCARIALGKLSGGTMQLVKSAPVAIRSETVYNIDK